MTDDVQWETPPPRTDQFERSKWWDKLDQLKTRPGQWAVIATDEAVGTFTRFQKHGFEFTSRGTKGLPQNRAAKVYGRYVGDHKQFANR